MSSSSSERLRSGSPSKIKSSLFGEGPITLLSSVCVLASSSSFFTSSSVIVYGSGAVPAEIEFTISSKLGCGVSSGCAASSGSAKMSSKGFLSGSDGWSGLMLKFAGVLRSAAVREIRDTFLPVSGSCICALSLFSSSSSMSRFRSGSPFPWGLRFSISRVSTYSASSIEPVCERYTSTCTVVWLSFTVVSDSWRFAAFPLSRIG